MSLRIVSVELEGFKSFKEKASVTFPENGVVLISGKWKDSSVSSGSGKSSILEAIAFALDISDNAATDLKNWDAKKMFVRLTLSDGTNTYELIRDPKLSLVVNGVKYESLSVGIKEKLTEILKSSPPIVKAITYRPQRERGKFINSTDSQLKQFLAEPLGLNEIEAAYEAARSQESELSLKVGQLTNELSYLMNLSNVSPEEIEESIKLGQAQVDELENEMSSAANPEESNSLKTQISALEDALRNYSKLKTECDMVLAENSSIKSTMVSIQNEMNVIEKQQCPTCHREWHSSDSSALLQQKKQQFNALYEKLSSNVAMVKNAQPILEKIPEIQNQKSQISAKLMSLDAPLASIKRSIDIAKSNLKTLNDRKSQYIKIKSKAEEISAKILEYEKELNTLKSVSAMIGRAGFLGSIFDEVLRDIEARTNSMIGYLPNISQFAVVVSSDKVNKTKGNIKKQITVNVTKDGKEVSLKTLSGGQQCALELCSDLASAEAIRSRSGSSLSWICLDEAMDGLGVDEKQSAIAMIKERVKGLVLIIDHATEIKEGFDKVIEVEFDGKESRVIS